MFAGWKFQVLHDKFDRLALRRESPLAKDLRRNVFNRREVRTVVFAERVVEIVVSFLGRVHGQLEFHRRPDLVGLFVQV